MPKNWIRIPTKKGEGVIYIKPKTTNGTYVKIQRAEPNSSNAGQRYDNVRWSKNGKSLDVNGNIVPRKSPESHILAKDFKFNSELFK